MVCKRTSLLAVRVLRPGPRGYSPQPPSRTGTCSQEMDISTVNALSYEEFVEVFGNVVEKCPLIAAAAWSQRPFGTLSHLEAAIMDFIDSLPESGKEGVLRCHPDLAGRDFQSGTLTADSREEQRGAGLSSLEPAELARISSLNLQYRQRFHFPFIICARMNNKTTILQQLADRLGNPRLHELEHAIQEVKKICHLRLQALLHPTPPKL